MKESEADTGATLQHMFVTLCADPSGTAGTLVSLTVTNSEALKELPEGPYPPLPLVHTHRERLTFFMVFCLHGVENDCSANVRRLREAGQPSGTQPVGMHESGVSS